MAMDRSAVDKNRLKNKKKTLTYIGKTLYEELYNSKCTLVLPTTFSLYTSLYCSAITKMFVRFS